MSAHPDQGTQDQWFAARREEVIRYLENQRVQHGEIAEAPAWYIHPHLSVWAVESGRSAGWVGWWVVCGDCPTDYVTCTGDRTPRSAIEAFVERWREMAEHLTEGEPVPAFAVSDPDSARKLGALLASRVRALTDLLADDSVWD
jgi:hypothetical protein